MSTHYAEAKSELKGRTGLEVESRRAHRKLKQLRDNRSKTKDDERKHKLSLEIGQQEDIVRRTDERVTKLNKELLEAWTK